DGRSMQTAREMVPADDDQPAARSPARSMTLDAGFRPFSRGIGLRLLTLIVLFSSVVTLLSTLSQLYFDYHRDVSDIERRLVEIERTYLGSLAGSLWHVDIDQLRLQLEGLLRLPDIELLEVRETVGSVANPLVIRVGAPQGSSVIARDYTIVYDDRGTVRPIGVLHVSASLEGVYRRLLDRAVVILVTQGVKTFLVSLFILYIVHRLVTRHLVAIAEFLGEFTLHSGEALVLRRRKPPARDELDQMVDAFNDMRGNLARAYEDLREANVALVRDNEARRRAEEEVNRLNAVLEQRVRQRTAELEAANAELSSFAYSVSHDLRAPLRRIEGFGQMLQDNYVEVIDEKGRHYLERIRAGTREMAEMIDSFLKLSRSTRGELTVEPLDLSAMVVETVAKLEEKDPERVVRVDIQPAVVAEGDRKLMAVVLSNLLENAWKYTRRAETAVVEFGMREEAGRPVYFIRDNGAGFDMAFVDRLFIPFHRLHKAEDFEGIGIGLATVQRIIARHGGRVWAEGEPGRGATFNFTCWEGREPGEQSNDPAGRG
ncbi:MAG: ATP-binding protein, partial [Pseudomonadota bacterium]